MRNKYLIEEEEGTNVWYEAEYKNPFNMLKQDNELFKDEESVPLPVISVRQVNLPKNGVNWEILNNGKVINKLLGIKFSNKEISFLTSAEGMKFLLSEYKQENLSINKLKQKIKKVDKPGR